MLYKEVITICSEFDTKNINTLCEYNIEMLSVKTGGAWRKP